MAMWRIRISLSPDPRTRARLDEVLAGRQVRDIRVTAGSGIDDEVAADVVLELPRDDELGDMLAALHSISPRVFVSRVSHAVVDRHHDGFGVLAPSD